MDTNKSLRERLLSGPLIDVYVGESKRHWALHRNLLSYHSAAFQSDFEDNFQDNTPTKSKQRSETPSENGRLKLPDVDPLGFELFVKYMYQGKLEDVSSISDPQDKYTYAVSCYHLHRLCDKLDMPKLKNIAMDQYRKGLAEAELVPDAEEINEIYRKSLEGSTFRSLVTKIAARQIMDPDSERDAESYRICFDNNPDFAIDLVNAIKAGIGGLLLDDPTDGDDCDYHDHSDGPNCHNKGKAKLGGSQPTETRSGYSFSVTTKSPAPILSPPATPTPQPRRNHSTQQTDVGTIFDDVDNFRLAANEA